MLLLRRNFWARWLRQAENLPVESWPVWLYAVPMTIGDRRVIFIGIGEGEDPLAGRSKPTPFVVSCAPCPRCGSPSRALQPRRDSVLLVCPSCGDTTDTGLRAAVWPQITFLYWCRDSKFASDHVILSPAQSSEIEALLAAYPVSPDEIPAWGVTVIGGMCEKSSQCVQEKCPYRNGLSLDRDLADPRVIPFPVGRRRPKKK